jgi:glycosyltransferase involved in cell wall biosynthesis
MRAGAFLEAYARSFDVTLVILPIAGPAPRRPLTGFLRHHARRIEVLPLDRLLQPLFQLIARRKDSAARSDSFAGYPWPRQCIYDADAAAGMLRSCLSNAQFAQLHVERIFLAPLAHAVPLAARQVLDLDEDDARVCRAIARLQAENGQARLAAASALDAEKFVALQTEYLGRFDVLSLASQQEAGELAQRYPRSRFAVVPNAIRPPAEVGPRSSGPPGIDYLFVGNLAYYPNVDGALFFCREVLPTIARAGGPVRLAIAGRAPAAEVRALAALDGVSVHADPIDVAPFYRDAAVAVVPLRAGGGSRVKILEAFAHGLPVVSTGAGAEGLEVVDGKHLLIANTPGDFAAAAVRLHADPSLVAEMTREARLLVDRLYHFDRVAAQIQALG